MIDREYKRSAEYGSTAIYIIYTHYIYIYIYIYVANPARGQRDRDCFFFSFPVCAREFSLARRG